VTALEALDRALVAPPRVPLATLPTPLERGPVLPGGARLWVKRDDLTGLGMGGNKARKLELLCGAAQAAGADTLITVGAGQSNHCRMTAAAGARLGWPVHLVLGGDAPPEPAGNQLLSGLFGAELHFTGVTAWDALEVAKEPLADDLRTRGRRPFAIPIGGSTPVGAIGFAAAFAELQRQCAAAGLRPRSVVHASSSGGTHAGLLAGRAAVAAAGGPVPEIVAFGVAKGILLDPAYTVELADATLDHLGLTEVRVAADDVHLDGAALGADYAQPTAAADAALVWAAHTGGWVLDRVYTAKACAGLLAMAEDGRWREGDDVVFWHTGGQPAVFAPGGLPDDVSRSARAR
jgi:1-aminocyclopropane-1-carboxylate deaminase/D-cysteine desulfhydrase-like pyridoxal-dependent ACC family enzyme